MTQWEALKVHSTRPERFSVSHNRCDALETSSFECSQYSFHKAESCLTLITESHGRKYFTKQKYRKLRKTLIFTHHHPII